LNNLSPQKLAESAAALMFEQDTASRGMGMQLIKVTPGCAEMSMIVRADMLNGHGICHGGYIFALADSAFAFACNSYNFSTVSSGARIEHLRPTELGEELTATAVETALSGRSGVYDVQVTTQQGDIVALFRGNSRRIKGTVLPEEIS